MTGLYGARPCADTSEREALLQEARHLRSQQRIAEALATLARLEERHPRFSRLYQERGHCQVMLRDAQAAIGSLCEAVRLNPALPVSWDMLEQLYRMSGDAAKAQAARQKLAILKHLPPELVKANNLMADGDLAPADTLVRTYLRKDGGNVGALRLLARISWERDLLDEAESLLQKLLRLAPDYHEARFDLSALLLHRQKYEDARQQAERLLRHDPENRDYRKHYGAACIGVGDHEPVIDLYAKLITDGHCSANEAADLLVWRANALKVTDRAHEAVADYRAALDLRPDLGVAWFGLANLKTYRFSNDDVARMRAAQDRPDLHDMDRVYLFFALGKAMEDRAEYAASWNQYHRGNALRRQSSRYQTTTADACAQRLKQVFSAEFFADHPDWGSTDPSPIFVVGLPRSGSTLIEQILASHSQVEGTQELVEIGRYAGELCGIDQDCGLPLDPAAIARLTRKNARALGQRFLVETASYRRLGRPFFIDKMPNNFWHIGLIHLILPKSIIIDVRREPMACCFSNLKQLFGTVNQEFAYGIDEIAHYYRTYLDLMRHWRDVLPGRVLTLPYEDVVTDLEGSTRRMLHHIGLPFEPACLTFHENPRSVRTPSSEQVRQPINRHGLEQWRNYAPWLSTLRDRLSDAVTDYRG